MSTNFSIPIQIEKVVEENSLLVLLESTVIIKKDKETITIRLDQISMVRVKRNKDWTFSILLFEFLVLFYFLVLSTTNLNFKIKLVYAIFSLLLFLGSFSIGNYTYKLLINLRKFGFNEITIAKSNRIHAQNFAAKFEISSATKTLEKELNFDKIKKQLLLQQIP